MIKLLRTRGGKSKAREYNSRSKWSARRLAIQSKKNYERLQADIAKGGGFADVAYIGFDNE